MNYLKSLTMRQWLIISVIVVFFTISYFIFFNRKVPVDQVNIDLEMLMKQGTAPFSADERLTKSELNTLMKLGTAPMPTSTASGVPKDNLTEEDKNALLKLMSAPRK